MVLVQELFAEVMQVESEHSGIQEDVDMCEAFLGCPLEKLAGLAVLHRWANLELNQSVPLDQLSILLPLPLSFSICSGSAQASGSRPPPCQDPLRHALS